MVLAHQHPEEGGGAFGRKEFCGLLLMPHICCAIMTVEAP